MYKREILVKGRKYYFYYHNIRENGKIRNVCLGNNFEKAKKKLAELNKKNQTFSFLNFIKIHSKNTLILSIIFLACLAYGFYSSNAGITGFATVEYSISSASYSISETDINGSGGRFGAAVTSGDVNGDNYTDLIVGSYAANPSDVSSAGMVYIFYGTANGIDNMNETYANVTLNGTTANDYLGSSVATGDVNNDSYADVIVGAYQAPYMNTYDYDYDCGCDTCGIENCVDCETAICDGEGECDGDWTECYIGAAGPGQAYVFFGSASGIFDTDTTNANITINGTAISDYFGYSVGTGDVNNDTYSDIIIGAYQAPYSGSEGPGQAYVFFGANFTEKIDPVQNASEYANITLNGTAANDYFGVSVASGDVNNDGYADIIAGASQAPYSSSSGAGPGQAYVFFGADFTEKLYPVQNASEYANITLNGTSANNVFGYSVATGDVNNDSYADVIVGANGVSSSAGQAYVFFGAGFTSKVDPVQNASEYANITINGTLANDYLGSSVGSGDINNDGYKDVIVGAYQADPPGLTSVGQAYVFYGADFTDKIDPVQNASEYANITLNGTSEDEYFGVSVGSGDFNNNSYAEIIVGDDLADSPEVTNTGRVYIFTYSEITSSDPVIVLNSPSNNGFFETPINFNYTVTDAELDTCELWGNWTGTWHLNETFVSPTSGVQNGSSVITLEAGSYIWNVWCNDTLGNSAFSGSNYTLTFDSATPTISLDGPANYYNETLTEGVVFSFTATDTNLDTCELWGNWSGGWHLNETFINPTSGVTQSSTINLANGLYVWTVYCNDTLNHYNNTVDNYTLNVDVPVTLLLTTINGTNTSDGLGNSITTGDVNGDGYKDIIVGASNAATPQGANAGQVYVFFGTANNGITDMDAKNANITINGTGATASFGSSVASGDFNNDGYSDIIVGVPNADLWEPVNNENNDGQVFIFFGADFGTTVINENELSYANITLNGTKTTDWDAPSFGWSVASGDVNNDGYSDIVVGAPEARVYSPGMCEHCGQAFVFFGYNCIDVINLDSALPYANITINSTGTTHQTLGSVVGSGDINNDSYDDIIVGDYGFSSNTGKAHVFYGSNYDMLIYLNASNLAAENHANITLIGATDDSFSESSSQIDTGDINNDGYADLIVGSRFSPTASYTGQVHVFFGADFGTTIINENAGSYANITLNGTGGSNEEFGNAFDSGDFNNDGYVDIIVGSHYTPLLTDGDQSGKVMVFYGATYTTAINENSSIYANITLNASAAGDQFGESVAVGDINNDGYANIIIGASNADPSDQSNAGQVTIYAQDYVPLVSLNSPLTDSTDTDGLVYFNYTAIDVNLDSCWLTINDDINVTNITNERYANFSVELTKGEYAWNVSCNDTLNNVNTSETWLLSVDTIPTVNLESPADATTWTSSSTVNFYYNVSDDGTLSNCTLIIDGSVVATSTTMVKDAAGQTFSYSLSNVDYNWSVNCTDEINNIGMGEVWNLTVNYVTPSPSPTSGGGGGVSRPSPAPPVPPPTPPPIPTPPAPVAPETPAQEAPAAEAVPELVTPLEIDTPEEVISIEEATYGSVSIKSESFGNGAKINVAGERKGTPENLTIYSVIFDKKPKFAINFDGEECDYDCPNCYDNVKDGDEEGVDCGGSCTTDCQGQIKLPVSAFECGDDICGAGEECLCKKDCGRIKCTNLTFDFENVLSWLLIFLLSISACIVTFPAVIFKIMEREPYFNYDKVLQDIQVVKTLKNLNSMLDTLQTQFRERRLKDAFSTYQEIRELYKTLPDDQKRQLYPRILLVLANKPKMVEEQKFEKFNQLVNKFETELGRKDYKNAIDIYEQIKKDYKELSQEEQKRIRPIIFSRIIPKLKGLPQKPGYKKTILKEVSTIKSIIKIEELLTELQNSYETKDYEQAKQVYKQIRQEYKKLPLNKKLRVNQKLKNILKGDL